MAKQAVCVMVSSLAGTRRLGQTIAEHLQGGEVILLYGEMGVGKTALTQGLGLGLGITEPLSSPTYTIVNTYEEGRLPFHHFDLYRLTSGEELYEMGFEDYLDDGSVLVIEWPERLPPDIVTPSIIIEISPGASPTARSFKILGATDSLSQALQEVNFA